VCKPGKFVAAAVMIVMVVVVVVVVIVAAAEVQARTAVNRQVSGRDVVLLWKIVADTSNKLLPMTGRKDSDHRYEKQHVV
jgi:CDP-diacylglycerol pyrophosphatase